MRPRVRDVPLRAQIQLHHPWFPGAWCDAEKLDCSTYFAYFGKYLLNQHYAIMPGVEAIRQSDWLLSVFGGDEEVFVRPAGCHKLFVGRCVHRESFASALSPARYDPATQVVVAAPREIGREWRLVVIGDSVIAASQYAEDGAKSVVAGCPDEVRDFVVGMLTRRVVASRPDFHDGRVRVGRAVVAGGAERLQLLLALSVRPDRGRGEGKRAGRPSVDLVLWSACDGCPSPRLRM